MMAYFPKLLLPGVVVLTILITLGVPLVVIPVALAEEQTHVITTQPLPTITPAPTVAPTSGRRERLEAPPLPTATVAVLIGANLLLAVGIVLMALVMRKRQQRR